LLSLPQGSQAREVLGMPTGIGKRLEMALGHLGRTESTVLLESPETLDAVVVVEGQAEAIAEAESPRPGLTSFTDGARTGNGAAGYAVVAKWTTMGWHQVSHGLQPGGLRYGVCSAGQSSGSGGKAADRPQRGYWE
jgi:hypothetical protein